MNSRFPLTVLCGCIPLLLLLLAAPAAAQSVAARSSPASSTAPAVPAGEDVVVLDPFTVSETDSEGYRAQSSASGLPFVVPIERTPLPIQVLTPEFIADTGSFTVEDALRFTSGVANAERNEYGTEKFVIRGFQTNSMFLDGVRMNFPTDASVIDRVEVLKGPSTIVYGELDPAGLVNVIPKRARMQSRTELSQTWDEYGTARSTIDINHALPGQIGPVGAAVRMIATWDDENSYLPNQFRERLILAPSVRLNVGRRTAIDINYIRQDESGAINRIQTGWRNLNEPFTFANGFVPVARNFTWVTTNDDWDFNSDYLGLQLTHEFGEDLHLFLGYANADIFVDQYFFLPNGGARTGPDANGDYFAAGRMTTQITERSNEVYTAKLAYDLDFLGTEHKLALVARRTSAASDQYGFQDSRQPVLGPYRFANDNFPVPPLNLEGLPRELTDPLSPFAVPILGNYANQDFDETMNWTIGATDYVTLFSDRLNVLAGVQYNTLRDQDRHAWVPQFGAVYELRPGWNLYALYSETFSPNVRSDSTDPTSPFLPPEEGTGIDVGLKVNLWENKLTGTLAAYQITRANVAQTLAGIVDPTVNITIPSGEEKSKGIELDLLYSPTPELSLNFAYAYTDAYISRQEINNDNPDLDGDGVSDAVGLPKEGVAEHDVRAWARYAFAAESRLAGLAFGGGFTWRQGPIQQFGTWLQRKVRQEEDTFRLDLFASYRTQVFQQPVTFRANWQNATDEVYRDRRGSFVIPSTMVLSAAMEF